MTTEALATARLLWQLGDWAALAALPASASASTALDDTEISLYRLQALSVSGARDEARALATSLRQSRVSRQALARALLSGAGSNLARAWLINDQQEAARRNILSAVRLNPSAGPAELVQSLRFDTEHKAMSVRLRAFPSGKTNRKIFVDCGGYDGCSVIMFLLRHQDFDVITFEPNPAFWGFYDTLPTRLQKAAAYIYDGFVNLIIDPIDGDGSSISNEKRIDFNRRITNEDCPVLRTPCIDLARVISDLAQRYEEVVLKLDVEGAEYDILEQLLETGVIDRISKLYCEFHGHKMRLAQGRHEAVVERVQSRVELAFWDALPFSFHCKGTEKDNRKRRNALLEVLRNRLSEPAG